MYNPDYPSSDCSWAQNTYIPTAMQQTQPYQTVFNPFDPTSRRNVGQPTNYPAQTAGGYNIFQQNPLYQQQYIVPESQVQPFSSYPPAQPPQTANMGFNQLAIDSRRNMGQQVVGSNLWNNAQTPVQQTEVAYGYNVPQYTGPYNNFAPVFDKKTPLWDNYMTAPQQIAAPQIDWSAVQSAQNQQQYGYNTNCVNYQINPANKNWVEIATQNFANI